MTAQPPLKRIECEEWPPWKDPTNKKVRVPIMNKILKTLSDVDEYKTFSEPVPADTPYYHETIPEAMDFKTMKENIRSSVYTGLPEFRRHLRLVIDNCLTWNT